MFRPQELARAVWRGNGDWGKPLYFFPAHPAFPVPPNAARAVNHGWPDLSVRPSPLGHLLQVSVDQGRNSRCPISLWVEMGYRGGGVVALLCTIPLWRRLTDRLFTSFQPSACCAVKPGMVSQPCQVPVAHPPSRPSPGWPFSVLLDPIFVGPYDHYQWESVSQGVAPSLLWAQLWCQV